MRNEELMERLARDAYVLGPKRDGRVGTLWDDLPDHNRECAVQFARNVLTTLRDLGPSEEMVEAAGATPGVKAVNAAMQMHQARGYGFADGSFDDGSPLHQMHRAMLSSLLGDPR